MWFPSGSRVGSLTSPNVGFSFDSAAFLYVSFKTVACVNDGSAPDVRSAESTTKPPGGRPVFRTIVRRNYPLYIQSGTLTLANGKRRINLRSGSRLLRLSSRVTPFWKLTDSKG